MNYPIWDVPIIGSGWVIGMMAIFHIMISHFAIGGGFYLPMAEAKALREGRRDWLERLRAHAKFFLILTGVFGALSGVGIWFAIGLANPEATSTLIHNFVFGWAMEWVVFIVELSSAAVYYYTWGRIPDRLHVKIGWVYGISAWLSLVIINGILTFMLTPGASWLSVAGTGNESSMFWQGFFNSTYWPSLCLRTTVCISLAGIWALLSFSLIDGERDGQTKAELIRWSCRWLIPAFLLMPVLFLWYLSNVPAPQRDLLALGMSTIGAGTFTQVTRAALIIVMTSATISGVAYFMAYRSPRDFGWPHAVAILSLALAATGATEYAREMLRKPFVIGLHMFSNGVRVREAASLNQQGYLSHAIWLDTTATTPASKQWAQGEAMFRGQCLACHTLYGYRSLAGYLRERDENSVSNILTMLHEYKLDSPYRKFMPPLVGTQDERNALARYLFVKSHPPAPPLSAAAAAGQ
jgi:cytochrome bd ubiquinol oxidase subunit I